MHLLSAISDFSITSHCFSTKVSLSSPSLLLLCMSRCQKIQSFKVVSEPGRTTSRCLSNQMRGQQLQILKTFAPPLIAVLIALSPINKTPGCLAQTAEIERGGALFSQSCIGCHDGGGNIIQPGATLFSSDLERNGADAEEEIYHITYYGKGRMPGFGENCKPRGQCTFGPRLQEDEIRLLAKFVKIQADRGWPNP